ncbi:MAG TPA: DUF3309 family protein [Methylophilus sp.]
MIKSLLTVGILMVSIGVFPAWAYSIEWGYLPTVALSFIALGLLLSGHHLEVLSL